MPKSEIQRIDSEISKTNQRLSRVEEGKDRDRRELSLLFGKIDDLVKTVATKSDVREIVKDHQRWEDEHRDDANENFKICNVDRTKLRDRVNGIEKWQGKMLAILTATNIFSGSVGLVIGYFFT